MFMLDCLGIPGEITQTINEVYKVLLIAVPILVVLFGVIDLVKAVIGQKDDAIKAQTNILVKRIITCLIVFFVFSLVTFLLGLIKTSEAGTAVSCLQEIFG